MFLLFETALGNVGLLNMMLIMVLGHVVTGAVHHVRTGIEQAPGRRRRIRHGQGDPRHPPERRHRLSLFVAQTISITFYAIALAIGLEPLVQWIAGHFGYIVTDLRFVSLGLILGVLVLNMMGGDITVRFLVPIVAVLGLAVLSFFVGVYVHNDFSLPFDRLDWTAHIPDGMPFWAAFALVFPAFTGNTMGIGLSGELEEPQREIPWGTKRATLISFVVYGLIRVPGLGSHSRSWPATSWSWRASIWPR